MTHHQQVQQYENFVRFANLIHFQNWTFAKTMPDNPHWYTVRKNWHDDNDFVFAVEYMRENGYEGVFEGSKYTYFNLNGWAYWTMGAAINKPDGSPFTIIINRKPVNQIAEYAAVYDLIADEYDLYFQAPEFDKEMKEACAMIDTLNGNARTLDIGCGCGHSFDALKIPAKNYVGIDPSSKMLQIFRQRFPEAAPGLRNCAFESFYEGKFDLIISLFGSISYVDPHYLHRITKMLNPGGKYFLMFFKPDYLPTTHTVFGIQPESFAGSYTAIPSNSIIEYNNYLIVKGQV